MTGGDYRFSVNMAGDNSITSYSSILVFSIFLLTSFNGSAQEKYDIGVFAGTSYYMGDLNSSAHYAMPAIAAGPIVRYNFNERNSLRFHAFYHGLRGSNPAFNGYNSDGGIRQFDAKFVDLGLDFEFNWKPYKTANRKTKASPYVFAGLGYGLNLTNLTPVRPNVTIPFGFGYKINLGKWLSAGIEASARKTFLDDAIDIDPDHGAITNPEPPDLLAPFGNDDWYFFTGLFVTYKFFKFWESCPTYD